MEKISIDLKNGFIIYPSREELSSLEGYVNNAYFKTASGGLLQFKAVIINNNKEYTINGVVNTILCQSLITELIKNTGEKVNLVVEKKQGEREYYLVKNKL